jgi:hypothetical protein
MPHQARTLQHEGRGRPVQPKRALLTIAACAAMILASGCTDASLPPEGEDPTLSCPEAAPPATGQPVLVFGLGRDSDFAPLAKGATVPRRDVQGEPALVFTVRWYAPPPHGTIAVELSSNATSPALSTSTSAPNALGCEEWMEAEVGVGVDGDVPAGTAATLRAVGLDEEGAEIASAELDVQIE